MILKWLQCLLSEVKVEFRLYFQNRVAVITDFLIYTILFAFFIFFNTGTSLSSTYGVPDQYSKMLLFFGYIIWMISTKSLNCLSSEIVMEANNGLLFYKLTSIVPLQFIYLGKLLASILIVIMLIAPLLIITMAIGEFFMPNANQLLSILLVNMVNIAGMYGLGLVLASLTMSNRRLSRISVLLSSILLFTTNALTYNEQIGTVLQYFPANYAIDFTRKKLSNGFFYPSDLLIFVTLCLVILLIGTFTFQLSINRARKKGNILWY